MIIRLRKRKRQRSGILRAPKRTWPRHRRFVTSHECACAAAVRKGYGFMAGPLAYLNECEGRIDPAHVRSAANAGTSLKPFDWFLVPLCRRHHTWQHDHGAESFQLVFGVDLWALAADLARRSPDQKMREAMKVSA